MSVEDAGRSVANGKSGEAAGRFTPTQQRILAVLADGEAHTRSELLLCVDPEGFAVPVNLQNHISSIRKILRPAGQDIICEFAYRKFHYRQVRLINRSE